MVLGFGRVNIPDLGLSLGIPPVPVRRPQSNARPRGPWHLGKLASPRDGPKPAGWSRWIGHWQQGGLLGRSSVGALSGRTLHSGAKLQLAPQSKHRVTLHSIGTKMPPGVPGAVRRT